jgi:hypothetical protein
MTWPTRMKLLIGVVAVLALVGVLSLRLDAEVRTVHGLQGALAAEDYDVGTDYSGVLVDQYVGPGDEVQPGDPLFALQSNRLRRDLASGLVRPEDSTYRIRDKNTLMFSATTAGTVRDVDYMPGAFVPANTPIASVEVADSLFVTAEFRLRPAAYALLREARTMTVTLPNGTAIPARITDVSVAAGDNIAHTTVRAEATDLSDHGLFGAGTPVSASIELPNHGLLASLGDLMSGLLTPRGRS